MNKLIYAIFFYLLSSMVIANETILEPLMQSKWYNSEQAEITLDEIIDSDVVIVNFWASWCAPCIREIPSIIKLADQKSTQVIFINVDNDGGLSSSQMMSKFKTFNILWLLDLYGYHRSQLGILSLPISIILEKQSNKCILVQGERNWSKAFLESELTK